SPVETRKIAPLVYNVRLSPRKCGPVFPARSQLCPMYRLGSWLSAQKSGAAKIGIPYEEWLAGTDQPQGGDRQAELSRREPSKAMCLGTALPARLLEPQRYDPGADRPLLVVVVPDVNAVPDVAEAQEEQKQVMPTGDVPAGEYYRWAAGDGSMA